MPDCKDCKHDHICCNGDAWAINLTPEEAKRFLHARAPDGQYLIATGKNGYCHYYMETNGDGFRCTCYEGRPEVCRRYDCTGKEAKLMQLSETQKTNAMESQSEYAGFFIAFIYKTDKQKIAKSMTITDVESLKSIELTPNRIFGSSEQDIKDKIIDIIGKPFQKEDI